MIGAALMTATGAHALLCLATMPSLLNSPATGFVAIALKTAGIIWNLAGMGAGIYAALQSFAIINARSLAKAQKAAIAALVLPLIGLTGGVTAFALLPIGAVAFFLFKSADWQMAFADFAVLEAAAEPIHMEFDEQQQDLAA